MFSKMIFIACFILFVGAMAQNSELQVQQSNGQFTKKLYKVLSEKEGNIFFSPLSAHTVLSMSYMGAAGSTEEAYVTALNLPNQTATADGYELITTKLNDVQGVTLYIANKVYVNEASKLKENFQNTIEKKFHSEVQKVNFADSSKTAGLINSWVEQKTNDKIKDLISADSLDGLTRLVLVNAVYFKGNWLNKFDKEKTRTEPFYLNEKDTIDVQMMHINKKFNYKHDPNLKAKMIELPYTNTEVSMVIILPDEKSGIKELERRLESTDLTKIMEGSHNLEVELALPKFKIETKIPLEEPLQKMGLGVIFNQKEANFSNLIEGDEQLYVSKVIQKAFIEVNEEGAEAAAATGLTISNRVSRRKFFLADHPFVFSLVVKGANGKVVLFQGKAEKPVAGDGSRAPIGTPVTQQFVVVAE